MSAEVIFIDDSETFTEMYRTYFNLENLDWKVFQNGYDALAYLEENPDVQAVVMDLAMPVVDGLQITEEIRRNESLHQDRKPVRIAFLTAYDKTKPVDLVMKKEKVEQFYQKNEPFPDLADKIKEWLNL